MVAVAIGAAAVIGAGASIYGANKAASAQKKAANIAAQTERDSQALIRSDLAPYREAGSSAVATYADLIGVNGPEKQAAAFANFRTDPGYQYSLDEGRRAIEGSAAARGGVLNGGTLKALERFGQGQADKQYGSYLDRFLNLTNVGQASAAQQANLGAASAARQGQYITDAGAAQAGGYLSAAQGVNGAISNGLQLYGYGQGAGWFNGNAPPPASSIAPISTNGYFPRVGGYS